MHGRWSKALAQRREGNEARAAEGKEERWVDSAFRIADPWNLSGDSRERVARPKTKCVHMFLFQNFHLQFSTKHRSLGGARQVLEEGPSRPARTVAWLCGPWVASLVDLCQAWGEV
jgi:hypothetical protein